MTTALVVGKFAPFHAGHRRLLDTALDRADRLVVVCWANPDFASFDSEVRAGWIRALYPSAEVIVPADPPADHESGEVHREFCRLLLDRHGINVDVVVSGEDYGALLAQEFRADHIRLVRDPEGVSGTKVRLDVHAHREVLDPIVYAHFVDRVALLGAESTGKSTLARHLAEAFGTTWVHEYGREHYIAKGGELTLEDYVTIARVHREREDAAALQARRWVFCDTNALTTMMYSHLYNRDSADELRQLADACAERYSLVVVCDDDIAFEQDGWRDNVLWRARMQGVVFADLAARRMSYLVVGGSLDERVHQVRAALEGRMAPSTHPPPRHMSLGPRPDAI